MCGGRAKPHKWAVLHQRSEKPLPDNGTTPSTQYHRCLPEEIEALGCAYGRSMDMVSIDEADSPVCGRRITDVKLVADRLDLGSYGYGEKLHLYYIRLENKSESGQHI